MYIHIVFYSIDLYPPFSSCISLTSFGVEYSNLNSKQLYYAVLMNSAIYSGMEVKHAGAAQGLVPEMEKMKYGNQVEKKKRLTSEQLDSLERSFQEEIKLDPDRKMKLSRELGLQPRQIAVWFQNRRARWKAKQLEHLYDSLKQEFDAISQEKQRLQEEVRHLPYLYHFTSLSISMRLMHMILICH